MNRNRRRLLDAISRPYGMVLVTGPTGSGKTVSLYTCLNILNRDGVNISTAEDPAEINLAGINQVNVDDKAGLTFAVALRAFLRQDPTSSWSVRFATWKPRKSPSRLPDRSHGDIDAAHQRCPGHPDPPDEYGRADLQYRLERSAHHRAAPGAPPVQLQEADRRTGQDPPRCGFHRADLDGSWTLFGPGGCERCKGTGYKGARRHLSGHAGFEAIQRLIMSGQEKWIWRNRLRAGWEPARIRPAQR